MLKTTIFKRLTKVAGLLFVMAVFMAGQLPGSAIAGSSFGNGAEVQAIKSSTSTSADAIHALKCAGESKSEKKAEAKSEEGKCGEGKCG
ncbi:MAG: hypothetical protein GF313_06860, partial [Caldithrix sp.]|nr:hypothetical protein [Caldithrix sp.]